MKLPTQKIDFDRLRKCQDFDCCSRKHVNHAARIRTFSLFSHAHTHNSKDRGGSIETSQPPGVISCVLFSQKPSQAYTTPRHLLPVPPTPIPRSNGGNNNKNKTRLRKKCERTIARRLSFVDRLKKIKNKKKARMGKNEACEESPPSREENARTPAVTLRYGTKSEITTKPKM